LAADLDQAGQVLTSSGGTRLAWRAWPVPSPRLAVAVAHGLGDHKGRYDRLAGALNRRRVACFAVDLRGHGESAGRRGHVARWRHWVDDFAAFYRFVSEEVPEVDGVEVVPLGHSFGGVVLASALVHGAVAPRRFVLSNPAFRPALRVPAWKLRLGRLASGVAPTTSLSNEVDPALISRDAMAVAAYREDPLVHDRITSRTFTEWLAASQEALEHAGEVTVPALVLLSERDRIIDPGGGREFAEHLGGPHTLRVYQGRYHEPFNDLGAGEVFADLAAWLERPVES
jgi:alpha-beta hydrolase superfamily lysophospholipase